MNHKIPVITIDGPSGSGKGTVSQMLSKHLHYHLLDSGALYRILAIEAEQHEVPLDHADEVAKLATDLDVRFEVVDEYEPVHVWLNGQDVTKEVRAEETGKKASLISAFPAVRAALLERQRAFRQAPGVVADGRDMGTVVFPDATVKIFLTASPAARAGRRQKQLLAQGIDAKIANLTAEIAARDARDSERAISPMRPAEDAVTIDTTDLSIQEVFDRILQRVQ